MPLHAYFEVISRLLTMAIIKSYANNGYTIVYWEYQQKSLYLFRTYVNNNVILIFSCSYPWQYHTYSHVQVAPGDGWDFPVEIDLKKLELRSGLNTNKIGKCKLTCTLVMSKTCTSNL